MLVLQVLNDDPKMVRLQEQMVGLRARVCMLQWCGKALNHFPAPAGRSSPSPDAMQVQKLEQSLQDSTSELERAKTQIRELQGEGKLFKTKIEKLDTEKVALSKERADLERALQRAKRKGTDANQKDKAELEAAEHRSLPADVGFYLMLLRVTGRVRELEKECALGQKKLAEKLQLVQQLEAHTQFPAL